MCFFKYAHTGTLLVGRQFSGKWYFAVILGYCLISTVLGKKFIDLAFSNKPEVKEYGRKEEKTKQKSLIDNILEAVICKRCTTMYVLQSLLLIATGL